MKVVIRLLKEIQQVRALFWLALVIFLLALLGEQLSPFVLRDIIDGSLTQMSRGNFLHASSLWQQLALYLGAVGAGGLLAYTARRILMHCSNRIVEGLRNRAYAVMQDLPISYFDDKPAGKIATRIVNDTETLRQEFYGNVTDVFVTLLRVIFMYGLVTYLNVQLGLALLLLAPVFYISQTIYKGMTNQPIKDFYQFRSDINNLVHETVNGVSVLQVYGQEDGMLKEFEATAKRFKESERKVYWVQSTVYWPLTDLIKHLTIAAILTTIGWQFLAHQSTLTPGQLFIYISYVMDIFDYLGMLVQQFPQLQRSIETGQRVLELLEEETEEDSPAELLVTDGVVIFRDVNFAYKQGQQVLEHISFIAQKGETIALVGHTGSGKSSIMNLLYRFYDPQEGEILIDGQSIRDYSRESLRSHMGIVLQDPYLFTGTVASNVAMSREGIDRKAVVAALEKVGASDLLKRLPKGIDEPVVERGAAFSSGERQLIAFARTLYANPTILILDEATSHIDTETEEIIQRAMDVVKDGRTSFIIAHRLSTIQHANQILVLDKGRIVERGTHEELLSLNGVYAQLYKIQEKV